MKIKVLTSAAGNDFSVVAGEIVEAGIIGGEGVAWAWIESGIAMLAPDGEAAAGEIARLNDELEAVKRQRDGHAAAVADALASSAKSARTIKAAEAERDVYKGKLADITTERDALRSDLARLTAVQPDP